MEQILNIITKPLFISIAALLVGKFIPNAKIASFFKGLGTACTLGMSKWLPGVWRRIEDWLIDALGVAVTAFIEGLRTDNKK